MVVWVFVVWGFSWWGFGACGVWPLGKKLIPELDLLITKLLWQEISLAKLLFRQKGFLANPLYHDLKTTVLARYVCHGMLTFIKMDGST